jgi:hypothetical protein
LKIQDENVKEQENLYFDPENSQIVEYRERMHSYTEYHPNKHPGEFLKN